MGADPVKTMGTDPDPFGDYPEESMSLQCYVDATNKAEADSRHSRHHPIIQCEVKRDMLVAIQKRRVERMNCYMI
jgi:hypothetical protein